jgi:hypothetical protein
MLAQKHSKDILKQNLRGEYNRAIKSAWNIKSARPSMSEFSSDLKGKIRMHNIQLCVTSRFSSFLLIFTWAPWFQFEKFGHYELVSVVPGGFF